MQFRILITVFCQ